MEDILTRHRKEKRDLQGRITQKKENATKKTRKGVNDECERLERQLADKHQAELRDQDSHGEDELAEDTENLKIDQESEKVNGETQTEVEGMKDEMIAETASDEQNPSRKPNRQRARLARRAADQQAQAAAAAEEAANMPNQREQELSAMKKQTKTIGLSETQIRPDGHCLFSACAHGMPPDLLVSQTGVVAEKPYQSVRYAAADFMVNHPDDFEAFMEEPLESYVRKVRETAEWGGELELQAIARSYKVNINVLRADGRVEKIDSGTDGREESETIWLAYYQHSFGLGEHYNALKKLETT